MQLWISSAAPPFDPRRIFTFWPLDGAHPPSTRLNELRKRRDMRMRIVELLLLLLQMLLKLALASLPVASRTCYVNCYMTNTVHWISQSVQDDFYSYVYVAFLLEILNNIPLLYGLFTFLCHSFQRQLRQIVGMCNFKLLELFKSQSLSLFIDIENLKIKSGLRTKLINNLWTLLNAILI